MTVVNVNDPVDVMRVIAQLEAENERLRELLTRARDVIDMRVGDEVAAEIGTLTQEQGTGEKYGKQVMIKLEDKTFHCDCGCNVFTRIDETSSFICNACRANWHGEPYTPFIATQEQE
jgi:hypothetical protein